jgi:hypothetical protein
MNVDRVFIVGFCWFALWIGLGAAAGSFFRVPGTGSIAGFCFALGTLFTWPFIMPERLARWMDRSYSPGPADAPPTG